jgi:hypothetical protein
MSLEFILDPKDVEEERKSRIKDRPKDEITGRLENWVKDRIFKIYWGNIYGNVRGRFVDGTRIHTSNVEYVKDNKVYTLNSIYELGESQAEKSMDI